MSHGDSSRLMSGQEKAQYGCVTTWENAEGQLLSVHRTGPPLAVLREIAADVQAVDASFRLVSYSTPETLMRDLDGNRRTVRGRNNQLLLAEQNLLSRIGLAHLTHPRLRSRDNSEARHRRVYEGKS